MVCCGFFFNDTATAEIYPLSLHDPLPILRQVRVVDDALAQRGPHPPDLGQQHAGVVRAGVRRPGRGPRDEGVDRSEEHTSELQSRQYLVCRLLLEKKKTVVV